MLLPDGSGALGLVLTCQPDLAVGATVALVAVAAFFASLALRRRQA